MAKKVEREIRAMAETFCEEVSIEKSGGNHLCITLFGPGGQSRKVFTGSTASDHRTMLNLKAQLRKNAVTVGCIPTTVH